MASLIEQLADYGVNIPLTLERFVGNEELYRTCLMMLLDDKNLEIIGQSLKEKDYEEAFNAAHALKGVVGNLGLTPLFNATSVLVEALRGKEYGELDGQYEELCHQFETVRQILQ